MREIKLRAWNPDVKKMIYGELVSDSLRYSTDDGEYFSLVASGEDRFGDYVEYKLMQFTGIVGKNGNWIWEGDVVESVDGKVFVVKFGNYRYAGNKYKVNGWYAIDEKSKSFIPLDFNFVSVGNIHENPELLKETK